MKVVYIVGITFLVLLMFIYQWPRIQSGERREKAAFAALTVMTSPAKIIDFLLVQLRNIVTSPF
ncbi:hypothetical protein [Paenibacillus sp. 7541]|uniref:hypothetical protein n=1 Tax=Paenibacillus sp. 7541 TaxID=2026236 RepID=UPI000BA6D279|nr:hypothetical protein [Paenibacillus sp. 7541]PAK53844.1 hypothetical protein CHH75_08465 [Paenibacillus sp. 7541]